MRVHARNGQWSRPIMYNPNHGFIPLILSKTQSTQKIITAGKNVLNIDPSDPTLKIIAFL
jgi:hypothetical protein